MKQDMYENLMLSISKSVKRAINESEEYQSEYSKNETKVFNKIDMSIEKLIGVKEEVKDKLIIKNPFNGKSKSIDQYVITYNTSKGMYSIFFNINVEDQKLSSIRLYSISGDNLTLPRQIENLSKNDASKLFVKFNQNSIQEFKDFMYNNGIHQFNWNSFLMSFTETPVSQEVKDAAKELYKKLSVSNKSINYFVDFLNILNTDGKLDYKGILINDIIPVLKEFSNKQKTNI